MKMANGCIAVINNSEAFTATTSVEAFGSFLTWYANDLPNTTTD